MTSRAPAWAGIVRLFRRASLALLPALGLCAPVHAQPTSPDPISISPLRVETEINNVNVTTGRTTPAVPILSIPAAPNLRFDRIHNAALFVSGKVYRDPEAEFPLRRYTVHLGEMSDAIECTDGLPCQSKTMSGATYAPGSNTYRQSGSGVAYHFNVVHYVNKVGFETSSFFYLGTADYPNGETLTYTYDSATLPGDSFGRTFRRPNRITSNLGFYIEFTYQPGELGSGPWGTVAQATLYASADPSTPLGRLTYSGSTVTDLGGRFYTCTCASSLGTDVEIVSTSMQLPDETAPSVQSAAHATLPLVGSVTRDGVSWTYQYSNPQWAVALPTSYSYSALTVTGPEGYNQVYNLAANLARHIQYVTSTTDSLNRRTSYSYDTYFRITQITYPELNRVLIAYDNFGNVTSRTQRARTGSGLADIVETANFATTGCSGVLCWRPTWTRDGLLRQTDYSYNSRGQLTEQLDPADASGVRRRTSITYVASPAGNSRRGEVRICADTGASCGANALVRTQYEYWGDTYLPSRERRIDPAGGAPLDTTYVYDPAGRLLSTDGPLPGTDDALHYRYDPHGRRTWEIGPRGPNNLRIATRTEYRDSDDKPILVERGTIPDAGSTALAVFSRTDLAYDGHRNVIREALSSAGTTHSVVDKSHDDSGRLVCQARRMNLAALPPVPADACAAGTPGNDGPDRIARNAYDAAGQRLQTREGVGTPDEAAEATWAYNLNGQVTTVIDGNGNRAELRYDGHGRQSCWIFPSPAGAPSYNDSSQATALASAGALGGDCAGHGDYEAYGYDAAGNRTSLRKRDGRSILYGYDALNRVTAKTYPQGGGGARPVYYGYDLRNLQTYARFDSPTGEGITNGYDGVGRLASSSIDMGGVTRTLAYQYDAAGNRTRITHPGGTIYFRTDHDALGRPTWIWANGVTGMAYQGYYPHGGIAGRSLANGATSQWGFDGAQRLSAVIHGLAGTTDDATWTYAYSPAGQIRSVTRDNDAYAWTRHYAVARAYTTNGLNQYGATNSSTGSGPASAAYDYDDNGNLIADGTREYAYDIENRLTERSGGTVLTYDPLGRLFRVTTVSGATTFLYDGDALVAEYNGSNVMTRRYVHNVGADVPLLSYAGDTLGQPSYLHADHQGSIVAVSDPWGAGSANTYDEYGIPGVANVGRFQYTGQIWLDEIGMYYYKARVYSPTLGRFLQTDPVGYEDQFNLYTYVGNDPVNHVDPSGEEAACFYGPSMCGLRQLTPEQQQRREQTVWTLGTIAVTIAPVGRLFSLAARGWTAFRAGRFARSLSPAFRQAAANGRHSGFLRNYADRSVREIQNGMRSIERGIAEHRAKIADPATYVRQTSGRDWARIDPREQQGLIRHWQSDIARQTQQRDILQDLVRVKQACTGTRIPGVC